MNNSKQMKLQTKFKLVFLLFLTTCTLVRSQDDTTMVMTEMPGKERIKAHVGLMQMIFSIREERVRDISLYDYYTLGLPVGITFPTGGRLLFDMEMVTFIKPYFGNPTRPVEFELLMHPGFLVRLGGGFSFGLRAAVEINQGNYGFTPLLNKSFPLKNGNAFFIELILPGRFEPEKTGTYTQELGIHAGFAF